VNVINNNKLSRFAINSVLSLIVEDPSDLDNLTLKEGLFTTVSEARDYIIAQQELGQGDAMYELLMALPDESNGIDVERFVLLLDWAAKADENILHDISISRFDAIANNAPIAAAEIIGSDIFIGREHQHFTGLISSLPAFTAGTSKEDLIRGLVFSIMPSLDNLTPAGWQSMVGALSANDVTIAEHADMLRHILTADLSDFGSENVNIPSDMALIPGGEEAVLLKNLLVGYDTAELSPSEAYSGIFGLLADDMPDKGALTFLDTSAGIKDLVASISYIGSVYDISAETVETVKAILLGRADPDSALAVWLENIDASGWSDPAEFISDLKKAAHLSSLNIWLAEEIDPTLWSRPGELTRALQIISAISYFKSADLNDTDNDGILDDIEFMIWGDLTSASHAGFGGDGQSGDGDFMADMLEYLLYYDGSSEWDYDTFIGVQDRDINDIWTLADSDRDGMPDIVEIAVYGNLSHDLELTRDGVMNDTDGDGMADIFEVLLFGNLKQDQFDDNWDSDRDGIPDILEILIWDATDVTDDPLYNSGPSGLPDLLQWLILGRAIEIHVPYGDITDVDEALPGRPGTYRVIDSDGDGIDDVLETLIWNNVNDIYHDSDADGVPDIVEWAYFRDLDAFSGEYDLMEDPDLDKDGILDAIEMLMFGDLTRDPDVLGDYAFDEDNDGLLDIMETLYYGTSEYNAMYDIDMDGASDSLEIAIYGDLATAGHTDLLKAVFASGQEFEKADDRSYALLLIDINENGMPDFAEILVHGRYI